ncbi:hypothetical protein ACJX0J_040938, partial [Zea mays]
NTKDCYRGRKKQKYIVSDQIGHIQLTNMASKVFNSLVEFLLILHVATRNSDYMWLIEYTSTFEFSIYPHALKEAICQRKEGIHVILWHNSEDTYPCDTITSWNLEHVSIGGLLTFMRTYFVSISFLDKCVYFVHEVVETEWKTL